MGSSSVDTRYVQPISGTVISWCSLKRPCRTNTGMLWKNHPNFTRGKEGTNHEPIFWNHCVGTIPIFTLCQDTMQTWSARTTRLMCKRETVKMGYVSSAVCLVRMIMMMIIIIMMGIIGQ